MRRRPEDFQAIRMLDKDTPIRQTQGKGGFRRNVNRAPLSSLRPESKYDTTDKELIQRITMAERMSDALPDNFGTGESAPTSSKRPPDSFGRDVAQLVARMQRDKANRITVTELPPFQQLSPAGQRKLKSIEQSLASARAKGKKFFIVDGKRHDVDTGLPVN